MYKLIEERALTPAGRRTGALAAGVEPSTMGLSGSVVQATNEI